jgi:hypothetical protein
MSKILSYFGHLSDRQLTDVADFVTFSYIVTLFRRNVCNKSGCLAIFFPFLATFPGSIPFYLDKATPLGASRPPVYFYKLFYYYYRHHFFADSEILTIFGCVTVILVLRDLRPLRLSKLVGIVKTLNLMLKNVRY